MDSVTARRSYNRNWWGWHTIAIGRYCGWASVHQAGKRQRYGNIWMNNYVWQGQNLTIFQHMAVENLETPRPPVCVFFSGPSAVTPRTGARASCFPWSIVLDYTLYALSTKSRTALLNSVITWPDRGMVWPRPVSNMAAVSGSQTLNRASAPYR
jgi:hypothetical protein